jgi:hypothetical protein
MQKDPHADNGIPIIPVFRVPQIPPVPHFLALCFALSSEIEQQQAFQLKNMENRRVSNHAE